MSVDGPQVGAGPKDGGEAEQLASSLTGDLGCAGCGYQLRGLSVRAVCPECGLPVSATILVVVDPKAGELQPVTRPRLVAGGLLLWSGGAVVAAGAAWALTLDAASRVFLDAGVLGGRAVWTVLLGVLLSGVGACGLIRPQRGVAVRDSLLAAGGVVLYAPLVFALWQVHGVLDPVLGGPPYFELRAGGGDRSAWRIASAVLMVLIVAGLRPNARLLASRSVLMRSGRVDRQTLLALVVALGVAAVGDVLHLAVSGVSGPIPDATRAAGTLLIGVGSALFTVGLVGVLIDCWRLRGVILRPPISYGDILGPEREERVGGAADHG